MLSKKEVAEILLKIGAVIIDPKKPYKYVSGILNRPIYIDCRLLMSYPKEWEEIIESFISIIVNEIGIQNIDVIAGTATAGIPHAAYIAVKLKLPMIYIRSQEKNHGRRNKLEGIIKSGDKVLLIEDTLNTGRSSISSARVIRDSGGLIENCLAIFTYGMKIAKKSFEKEKIKLNVLTDFNTLINVAVRKNNKIAKELIFCQKLQRRYKISK